MPQQATMGPALMEGVERMNAVVVRGQGAGQSMGVPPRWDPYTMEVDRGRNCYACGVSGIWPAIAEIEEEEDQWKEEGWSIVEEGLRRFLII